MARRLTTNEPQAREINMQNECPKKFRKPFYAAQELVEQAIRKAGFRTQCLNQHFSQRDAIEIFSLSGGGNLGIIMVRYIYPISANGTEPCGVFFFYDEGLVGKLAGLTEFGTWDSSTKLLGILMPAKVEG